MVAIEEVLTATTGAFSFSWQETRDGEGLEIVCTPAAPDWVESRDREGWELAHGLDVWVAARDRALDELRASALVLMLSDAIRRGADTPRIRANELEGLAA